jgi:hypothetical protein
MVDLFVHPEGDNFIPKGTKFAPRGEVKNRPSGLQRPSEQGCHIFLGPKYQYREKYTKLPQNIPNGHKIFPMAVK